MYNENFLGFNSFIWFFGVVEDRSDPYKTGRVRVRILGHHTPDKIALPTADLPWAQVMQPTTSAGISGLGHSPTGLVEGSWVLGYFKDGMRRQDPIILGSVPGNPINYSDTTRGFNDPNGIYPKYINEPDNNRLAVNAKNDSGAETNPHPSLTLRRATRITGVPTADFNSMDNALTSDDSPASDGDTWNQPNIPYDATYPFNTVYESESGHLLEFDDTLTKQRIHLRHRTGTGIEMDASGTRTDIVSNEYYSIISSDSKVLISGDSDTTINGRHKLFINRDGASNNSYDIQVGPNANVNIQVDKGDLNIHTADGRINMNAAGDYNLRVGGNMNIEVEGSYIKTVSGSSSDLTDGAVIITGSTVNLNP